MRRIWPGVLVAGALLLAGPAATQEIEADVGGGEALALHVSPGQETRTPGAVTADTFELYATSPQREIGRVSIPDDKLAVLQQPQGRDWRTFRIHWVFWLAAAAIIVMVAVLAAFFFWRGRIRIESGRFGRWVPRFRAVERFAHWITALSFIVLALSGLVVTFGRTLLIPIIGHASFSSLSEGAKNLHNWSGAPSTIGIVLILFLWVHDNLPERADWEWLRQGGGMFGKDTSFHPETGRFNAGQKLIFWSVVLFGLALAVSGFLLMTPFAFTGIVGMQWSHGFHAIIAILLFAVIIAHIYIGTLGMDGAFDAMGAAKLTRTGRASITAAGTKTRSGNNRRGRRSRYRPGRVRPSRLLSAEACILLPLRVSASGSVARDRPTKPSIRRRRMFHACAVGREGVLCRNRKKVIADTGQDQRDNVEGGGCKKGFHAHAPSMEAAGEYGRRASPAEVSPVSRSVP